MADELPDAMLTIISGSAIAAPIMSTTELKTLTGLNLPPPGFILSRSKRSASKLKEKFVPFLSLALK